MDKRGKVRERVPLVKPVENSSPARKRGKRREEANLRVYTRRGIEKKKGTRKRNDWGGRRFHSLREKKEKKNKGREKVETSYR